MLRIAGLALLALIAGTLPAAAEPISLAFASAVSAVTTAASTAISSAFSLVGIVGGLIKGAFGIGLALIANALRPKAAAQQGGIQSQLQIGGDVPRFTVFGPARVKGQFVYGNTSGDQNGKLCLVYVVGQGEFSGLQNIWVNGKEYPLERVAGDPRLIYKVGGFDSRLIVRLYPGTATQEADDLLISTANPAGRWTAAHRGVGIAYLVIEADYHQKTFPNGIPDIFVGVQGLKLYDFRKDATAGGSGSHRWDDRSTWEYSENPTIGLYNFMRGIRLNGQRLIGMDYLADDFDMPSWIAAANACDEQVNRLNDTSEARYKGSVVATEGEDHSQVAQKFITAMGGTIAERGGVASVFAGVAQIPVMTITDDDLLIGRPMTFTAKKPRDQRLNAVFAKCARPDTMWQVEPLPPLTSPAWEAQDGGERLASSLDLSMVFSQTQGQRLAVIAWRGGRYQAEAQIALPFKFNQVEHGDWIVWSSARYGERTFVVTNVTIETDHTITWSLAETSADIYSWLPGQDQQAITTPGSLPARPPLITSAPLFAVSAVSISQGGVSVPALEARWTPIADQTARAVRIEWRRLLGQQTYTTEVPPENGAAILVEGVAASEVHEVRHLLITDPDRGSVWSPWMMVQALSASILPVGSITLDMLTPEARAALTQASTININETLTALRSEIERLALVQATDSGEAAVRRQLLKVGDSRNFAAIEEEKIVRATADLSQTTQLNNAVSTLNGNISTINTTLGTKVDVAGATAAGQALFNSAFGANAANLQWNFATEATAAGAVATFGIRLRANGTASFGSSSFLMSALSDGTSRIDIRASRLNIIADDNTTFAVFDGVQKRMRLTAMPIISDGSYIGHGIIGDVNLTSGLLGTINAKQDATQVTTSINGAFTSAFGANAGSLLWKAETGATASGASASLEFKVRATGTATFGTAAFRMNAFSDGTSGIDFQASRTRFIADDGTVFVVINGATKQIELPLVPKITDPAKIGDNVIGAPTIIASAVSELEYQQDFGGQHTAPPFSQLDANILASDDWTGIASSAIQYEQVFWTESLVPNRDFYLFVQYACSLSFSGSNNIQWLMEIREVFHNDANTQVTGYGDPILLDRVRDTAQLQVPDWARWGVFRATGGAKQQRCFRIRCYMAASTVNQVVAKYRRLAMQTFKA